MTTSSGCGGQREASATILQEGVRVVFGADNRQLLGAFREGLTGANAFKTGVVAAMAATTAQSVRMAAQLDKDLRLVQTLGGEAATSVGQLRHEIGELSKEFGRSQNELARANYQAVSGGFKSITESMKLTTAGTKLATAGNADLVSSTEAVVKALNAFDMSAADADKAAAQLWGITRDGIITVEQLGRFLADLPISAASSGLAFEEMSAAISTLTAEGVPASTAMDQLRSAIIQLEKKGITGTLVERVERFAGQGLGAIVEQVGDQTAARGLLVLANNMEKLTANVDAAGEVMVDYASAVDTMNSGPMAEWNKAVQELNDGMSDLGNVFLPVATGALKGFSATAEGIRWLVEGFGDITTFGRTVDDWSAIGERIRARSSAPDLFTPSTSAGAGFGASATLGSSAGGIGAVVGLYSTPGGLIPIFGDGGAVPGLPGLSSFGTSMRPPADIPFTVPFTIDTDPGPVGMGVPIGGYGLGSGASQRAEAMRYAYGTAGALGPNAGMGDAMDDVSRSGDDLIRTVEELDKILANVGGTSQTAAQMASILSSSLGGLLVSAFSTADSAVARFVQGLLAQMAQLGMSRLISSIFTAATTAVNPAAGVLGASTFMGPPMAGGGYTGSNMGMYHPGEYIFSASAVKALGLGSLDRAHEVAKVGGANVTINQTVNGGNPTQVAQVTKHAVESAIRESNSTGTNRLYRTGGARWR